MRSLSKAFLAITLLFAGCSEPSSQTPHLRKCGKLKIVSTAPNVTEILYSLGLSNEVVGVSRYSTYPPEAADKPQIGGTYDPNWEMIVSLKPDLVIGLDSQEEMAVQLKALDIDFLGVPHERIDEVIQSILIIGEACGAEEKAAELVSRLQKNIENAPPFKKIEQLKVLVCVGHNEQLTRMYVAAHNTFYDDLIRLAGGINACTQTAIKYPEISPEGLRAMRPDLIIDISPGLPAETIERWAPYRAVLMTNSYAFIPGPRFGLLLTDFIGAIHE